LIRRIDGRTVAAETERLAATAAGDAAVVAAADATAESVAAALAGAAPGAALGTAPGTDVERFDFAADDIDDPRW
jgi:hypothetical protein